MSIGKMCNEVPADSTICIPRDRRAIGGPRTFVDILTRGLKKRGLNVVHDLRRCDFHLILIIGASRNLLQLRSRHGSGIPIVQRLGPINWMYRIRSRPNFYTLKSEIRNRMLEITRQRLADHVVYQSEFVSEWWMNWIGPTRAEYSIIPNGVSTSEFSPAGSPSRKEGSPTLLMVEGALTSGYEVSVEWIVEACKIVRDRNDLDLVLKIAGQMDSQVSHSVANLSWVRELGTLPREEMPNLYRSATLFFSGDINAACPNSVLEALASGVLVIGFATGALPELLRQGGGIPVPYGSNPWKLDGPDIEALAAGILAALGSQSQLGREARQAALTHFSAESMVDSYWELFKRLMGA